MTFGEWCPYGLAGELPSDQRPDDGRSVCFDSEPLCERIEIFGAPVVTLDLACDKPSAMIAARLKDVAPDGSSTLVTYGLLNLTHRDGHEHPQALVPGRTYRVKSRSTTSPRPFPRAIASGWRSPTSYWPIAWPSPEMATLHVSTPQHAVAAGARAVATR